MKTIPSTTPRLAPAALNSVAPVRLDRSVRSRRNCTASPPLISGGAARHIESLSAVALPYSGEKGGGERWRWVSKPKPSAPWPTRSGRERRDDDASLQVRSALDHGQVRGYVRSVQAFDSSRRAGFLLHQWSFALLRERRVWRSGKPGIFGAGIRRGEQHFDVGREGRCIREIVAVAVRK
jgi:hypothetical protein